MNQRARRTVCCFAVGFLMLGAICWAGTKRVDRFTLANIKSNGQLGGPGPTVNFNYVLDRFGNFVGSASGVVKNHCQADVAFQNVGGFNNLTVVYSLYIVDDVGDAVYTAGGTKP